MVEHPLQHKMRLAPARPQARESHGGETGAVVLEATRRGREELDQPRFGLGGNQRRLLALLDGERTLHQCLAAEPKLKPSRLERDAARLVAFGLARTVRGELPQSLIVEAMNLTARIPLDQLPPLEPERTVIPMQPRVGASPHRREPAPEPPPITEEKPRWSVALLLTLVAAAVAAISYLT